MGKYLIEKLLQREGTIYEEVYKQEKFKIKHNQIISLIKYDRNELIKKKFCKKFSLNNNIAASTIGDSTACCYCIKWRAILMIWIWVILMFPKDLINLNDFMNDDDACDRDVVNRDPPQNDI